MKEVTPPVILLTGPTAAGKTELALSLVAKLPLEIISVDSAMVYRGLDIGTGKPDAKILAEIPHHLIDICDASEIYSAAQFREDALQTIQQIQQKGKIPLLVGGTLLYFRIFREGIANLPSSDAILRAEFSALAEKEGLSFLHAKLQEVDPEAAKRIHQNDPQRLIRALEIFHLTGLSLTEHLALQAKTVLPFHCIPIAIAPMVRSELHEKIARRFQQMLEKGFVEEVAKLYERTDLDASKPALRTVGYRQIWQFLNKELDFNTMQEKALTATRQLAKRQFTWLRAWQELNWLGSDDTKLLEKTLKIINTTVPSL